MIRLNSMNYNSIFRTGGYRSVNSLYSSLSQLSSVRSGAYAKALRAYYDKSNNVADNVNSSIRNSRYGGNTSQTELQEVKRESGTLATAHHRAEGEMKATSQGEMIAVALIEQGAFPVRCKNIMENGSI